MGTTPLPLSGSVLDDAKKFQPRLKLPSGEESELINVWARAVICSRMLCFLYVYEWSISRVTLKTIYHYVVTRTIRKIKKSIKKVISSWKKIVVTSTIAVVIVGFLGWLINKFVMTTVVTWVLSTIVTFWLVWLILIIIAIIVLVIVYYLYKHEWDYEPVIVCTEGDVVLYVCFDAGHYSVGKQVPPTNPPILEVIPGTHNYETGLGNGTYTSPTLKELTQSQLDDWQKKLKDLPRGRYQPILSLQEAFDSPCSVCNRAYFSTPRIRSVPK